MARALAALGRIVRRSPAVLIIAHLGLAGGQVRAERAAQLSPFLPGYADLHVHALAHLAFGGGAVWGAPFPDLAAALPDCSPLHGDRGCADVIGNALRFGVLGVVPGPDGVCHSTSGFPEFEHWPDFKDRTHQQVHVEWLKRAFDGGLRLMVLLAVDSPILCELVGRKSFPCGEMAAIDRQIQAAYDMERFIDAQPGGGWFRIVKSAAEARQAITEGKLAVVLGIETSTLFNCAKAGDCTEADVKRELRRYYQMGVRHIFPVHHFNNAFAGPALFSSFLTMVHKAVRGEDLQVRNCAAEGYAFDLQLPDGFFGPLKQLAIELLAGVEISLPELPAGPDADTAHCNALGLTSLGQSLIRKMMSRKMVLDVDHMSRLARDLAIQLAETHRYPAVVAGHTRFSEISRGQKTHEWSLTASQLQRIYQLGGIVGIIFDQGALGENVPFPAGALHTCGRSAQMFAHSYRYAIATTGGAPVAFGSDFTGFAPHAVPRVSPGIFCDPPPGTPGGPALGAPLGPPVLYPFPLFLNPNLTMDRLRAGDRLFDINFTGVANIGLLPDFVRELEVLGVDVHPLFGSADRYVRMWEQLEARSFFPPNTSLIPRPAANPFGWNNTQVQVILSVSENPDGWPVAGSTYQVLGPQPVPPGTTPVPSSVTLSAEGIHTVTLTAVDEAGNRGSGSLRIRLDSTPPDVRLVTDKTSYTVDESVKVSCAAGDALSGLARTLLSANGQKIGECQDQTVPAADFQFGLNQLVATVDDRAGNSRSRSVSFTALAQLPSLCNLTRQYFADAGVANGLCAILERLKAAKDRGTATARNHLLDAYTHAVTAHSGKRISAHQAETLIRWARAWALN
ncbi:MAG TPA: membrane dipeptidase [Vicinamibacterales bacterium]|nr:membrane dipeptidase [Vicinamibacterales bacterium]